MRIFQFILGFVLGISIFLLGLRLLSTALQSILGFRLRVLLTRLTATKERSLIAGLVSTFLVQSSSAVGSTMVVLVDSGILTLEQAFGVMLGANIGTTLTAQIVVFPLERLALPLVVLGLILYYFRRRPVRGKAVVALGAVFYGLNLTSRALAPLLELPLVQYILTNLTDTPLEACLVGVVLTALVQSSSAVTSLVVSLMHHGQISLMAGVGLALGSNIGTVVTTLLASWGRERASRATAYADFIFNLGGVLLILPCFSLFLRLLTALSHSPARQVAHAHTIFNLVTALLALPFLEHLAKLAWYWAGIRVTNKNSKE